MQEHQATFNNPIEIYPMSPPWQTRLFILYLLVVSVIAVVKSLSLAWQLGSFSLSRRTSLQKSGSETEIADSLAGAALANKLSYQSVEGESSRTVLLGAVRQAENKFLYLWEMCSSKVMAIRRLAILTSLFAILVFVWLTMNSLVQISTIKAVGFGTLAGGLVESFVPLMLGILVCTVLYAISSFYEGVLMRRKTFWNYFCAKTKNESPAA